MSEDLRILAFAGSTRTESFNKMLAGIVARGAEEAGAEIDLLDLRDFPLPLFDQDLEDEKGLPESAILLKERFIASHALLIASPEYNGSITGVLKNALDWMSRPVAGEKSLAAYRGKVAGLVSTSPGALGGMRALVHVRAILGNLGVLVVPGQVAVPKAYEAFDETGELRDKKLEARVMAVGRSVADLAERLLH
jgi:chromate reductase